MFFDNFITDPLETFSWKKYMFFIFKKKFDFKTLRLISSDLSIGVPFAKLGRF